MNYYLLIDNLTNPALLFFVLGIIAVYLKSDLEIPPIRQNLFLYTYYLPLVSREDKSCRMKHLPQKLLFLCFLA